MLHFFINIYRQHYLFYISITFVYTAKGKQVTQYMSLFKACYLHMDRTTRAGVHSQKKAAGPLTTNAGGEGKTGRFPISVNDF